MAYKYEEQKGRIFTESGMMEFMAIRDRVYELLAKSGAFMAARVLIGDVWLSMACIDRMVEIGEILEVTDGSVAGQHRVFIKAK